jgi:outer membrane protein OmpA-like peptidoglycan-associated protein
MSEVLKKTFLVVLLSVVTGLSSCVTNQSKTTQGAATGAVAGGILGALVSKDDKAKGALIGALIGTMTGAAIGSYLDRKEQEMRKAFKDTGIVERPSESELRVTFSDSVPFNTGSSNLRPEGFGTLYHFANLIRDNSNTRLIVTGHTDNKGNHLYNQKLSEERAGAVAKYLVSSAGISMNRVVLRGAGEMAPMDSNNSYAGRRNNRRVDILIMPIDEAIPPVAFKVFDDTEPKGSKPKTSEKMIVKPVQQAAPVRLTNTEDGEVKKVNYQTTIEELPVKEVVKEKPHLYSPIRSVEELMAS